MTLEGYFAPTNVSRTRPPAPLPPAVTLSGVAWRAVVSVLVTVVGVGGAIVVAFATMVVWSGCFLSCQPGNHPLGAVLGVLTVLLLAAGPWCAARLFGLRGWWPVVGGTVALALVAAVPFGLS